MQLLRSGLCSLGLCCAVATTHAEPLPVRDLNPLLSGYELPAALGSIPLDAKVSFDFATANISLDQHAAHEALQADAEVQRWQFNLIKPLSDTLALQIDVPYVRLSGGKLDNFIDSFHGTFGLPNGNRDLWPHKRLWIAHARDDASDFTLRVPQQGIGDLGLRLAKQLGARSGLQTALWLSVKLPTGNAHRLTGSGSMDVALSFASEQPRARFTTWQQISLSALGSGKRLATQQESLVWSGSLGVAAALTPRWSAALQLDGHTRVFDSELRALGNALQLSVGPRYRFGDWSGALLITEDIAVDTAPDVQLQLHLTCKL